MGLREEKKAQQRHAIWTTAIELFRRDGYDRTRVKDIASAVGISEATFFNYFPTKDSILQEQASSHLEAYEEVLRAEIDAENRPVVDRLRELMDVIALSFEEDKSFNAVVVSRTGLLVGATGDGAARLDRSYQLLARLFLQGQERHEIRADVDAMQLAELFTGTYVFTITNWLTDWWDDEQESLVERLRGAVDVFLTGVQVAG